MSEKGLGSLLDTVLPRFEADASSTMGVMGVRRPDEGSYDVIRCDILGRAESSDGLSEKGLLSILGVVSWNSVSSESRSPADLPRSVCLARA